MNIPNGFKLVPVEPTEEMIEGFWGEITHGDEEREAAKLAYSDMLAAAPTTRQPIYDEAKERELFELERFKIVPAYRKENGEYKDFMDEAQWFGWKSCAKSRARSAE